MTDLEYALHYLDAVAVGSGPTSRLLIGMHIPKNCKLVGAGNVTKYLTVDYYAYGDTDHTKHVPMPPAITYSTRRVAGTAYSVESGIGEVLFPEAPHNPDGTIIRHPSPEDIKFFPSGVDGWHHGCSSGGMAITIACKLFKRVGVIGFDCYYRDGRPYDPPGLIGQQAVLDYWREEGRELISLMEVSLLNDKMTYYGDYVERIKAEQAATNPHGDRWLGS